MRNTGSEGQRIVPPGAAPNSSRDCAQQCPGDGAGTALLMGPVLGPGSARGSGVTPSCTDTATLGKGHRNKGGQD